MSGDLELTRCEMYITYCTSSLGVYTSGGRAGAALPGIGPSESSRTPKPARAHGAIAGASSDSGNGIIQPVLKSPVTSATGKRRVMVLDRGPKGVPKKGPAFAPQPDGRC